MSRAKQLLDKRILVIDDDPQMQDFIRCVLEQRYRNMWFCDRSRRAVECAIAFRPDIILLDMIMPGQDGVETYNALKRERRTANIPVLGMSGLDKGASVLGHALIAMGADGFLRKPFKADELLGHIERLMQKGAARAQAILERGRIRLDTSQRSVWIDGRMACKQLSPMRFLLLCKLMQHDGPISRQEICGAVWPNGGSIKVVDVNIGRLRQDLGIKEDEFLISVPGGYHLVG